MAGDLHSGKGTGPGLAGMDAASAGAGLRTETTFSGTAREFRRRGLGARAVRLTCYGALSLFGSLVALAAIGALAGDYPRTSDGVLDFIGRLGSAGTVDAFRGPVEELVRSTLAGVGLLAVGIVAAVRFGSGYTRTLRRAVQQMGDGKTRRRPRPPAAGLPALLATCLLVAGLFVAIVLTGPLARAAAETLGVGDGARTAWGLGKWPVMAVCYSALFIVLYCTVLNPRPAGLRALSPGQLAGVLAWVLALGGVVFYVVHFGSVNETYGGPGASFVSLLWLTMLGVLYFVTPSLRFEGFGAVMPGLAISLAISLAASAGLAAAIVALDPFADGYRLLGVVGLTVAWIGAANVALLLGAMLNVELDRRPETPWSEHLVEPQPERTPDMTPDINLIDLVRSVTIALRNDSAHHHMWSVLPGGPHEVPELLSELEGDLNDWGFAYGVAWAVARARDPFGPDERVAARALEAAKVVFDEYCDGDDWAERIAERRAELAKGRVELAERRAELALQGMDPIEETDPAGLPA